MGTEQANATTTIRTHQPQRDWNQSNDMVIGDDPNQSNPYTETNIPRQ